MNLNKNMSRIIKWILTVVAAGGFFALLYNANTEATLKYKKETGKKCAFCHTGIPREGDENPQLNEDGKTFKENGNRLTEEQKKKADPE